MKAFAEVAFTPSVRRLQTERGSRDFYARLEARSRRTGGLGECECDFLAAADSFFLATVSESGWPYVQHRGGPKGFVKVISPSRIAFAEFCGNRQYVTAGNVQGNNRVALIIVDYPSRQRLKLMGRLRLDGLAQADPELLRTVDLPHYKAQIDAVTSIEVEAFDWNCTQHIMPRFTEEQIAASVRPLYARIAELEAEIARLIQQPRNY